MVFIFWWRTASMINSGDLPAASRDDMVHILSSQHYVGWKHILCDFKTLPRRKVLKTMEKKHEWGDFRTIVEDKGPSVLKTVSIIEEGQHWQYKHQKKWKWWWFWSMIIIISVGTTLAVKIPIIENNYLTSITSNLNYTTEKKSWLRMSYIAYMCI